MCGFLLHSLCFWKVLVYFYELCSAVIVIEYDKILPAGLSCVRVWDQ